MEKSNPEAQAVAVKGKRIVAIGSVESVKAALGDKTFVLDETFKGKIIMPGFIEQHMHPILGALTLSTEVIANEDWDLPGKVFKAAITPKQYQDRLKAAEAALKDPDEWLYSYGYHKLWHGELSRAVLDGISRTRPIVIWQRSCHEFILNTAAIEALKLDKAAMDGHGLASTQYNWNNGHWWENGATELLFPKLLPKLGAPQRIVAGLKMLIAYYRQKGVTALNEPGILMMPGLWDLYQKVLGAQDVPFYSTFFPDARTQMNVGLHGSDALVEAEKKVALGNWNDGGKVSMFAKQIKLLADGAIVSQAMMMKDGYTDGHHGEWMMTPEALESYGKLYWDAGYQLHIHITGDLGMDVVLDMLERRMRENPRSNHRTVIVHFSNSTEEQVERIARLGAIVSANPYYPIAFSNKYAQFGLGAKRANAMVRNGSVIRHGIPLSFHSDLPIAPSDPLFLAWSAVNRKTNEGNVVAPEQRIGVHDALRAITIEAAYSWQKENELGSIAPGKIANFTVLEQDPYTIKPIALKNIPIWGTVFEGRLFENPVIKSVKKASADGTGPKPIAFAAPLFLPGSDSAHGDSCDIARKIVLAIAPFDDYDTRASN
jgi:predicted amidohydrolase YtcJ